MKKENLLRILPWLAFLSTAIGILTPVYFNSVYPGNGYWFFAIPAVILGIFGIIFGFYGFTSGAKLDQKFSKFINKSGGSIPSITDSQVEESRTYIKLRGFLIAIYSCLYVAGLITTLQYVPTKNVIFILLGALAILVGTPFLFMFLYYDFKMLKERLPQLTFIQYLLIFAPIGQ